MADRSVGPQEQTLPNLHFLWHAHHPHERTQKQSMSHERGTCPRSAMGRRRGPAHLSAKVAHVMLLITVGAQWCRLVFTPILSGASLRRMTEVAEAAGDQATVDTRPQEYLVVRGNTQHFKSYHISSNVSHDEQPAGH